MSERPETASVFADQPKAFTFALVAIPFTITTLLGIIVTAVAGLTVYADVADVKSRDFQFMIVALIGVSVSLVAGYVAARHAVTREREQTSGQAVGLLRKYRRAIAASGEDKQAGQYHIGETYLRELLGRRGA